MNLHAVKLANCVKDWVAGKQLAECVTPHLNQMSIEGVSPENLVLAVCPLILHLPRVLLLLLALLHHLDNGGEEGHPAVLDLRLPLLLLQQDRPHHLAKNFSKYIHSGGLDAEPPVKVAEVVKELLEVLRVVDLAHNLLYHTQNVHPVPV